MKIILLRHGIAAERGTLDFERDSERPLTPEGRGKVRLIAKALARLKIIPDVILTSPFVRAHQTAEIAARVLRRKQQLHFSRLRASGAFRSDWSLK
jgi:phosphohistidine phosphatase